MKKILFIVVLLFLFIVSRVDARSGCCSYHGGQSYCDSSVGRWVCNDGTYSPSCGCGYLPPIVDPFPPTPQAPIINAGFTYEANANQTYNVTMKWNHVDNTGFSLALHNIAGGDPGPLTDTTNDYFTFYNVSPGVYYVDMKVGINGIWSNVTYWKIEVPNWRAPTPTPTPTNAPEPTLDTSANNKSFISSFFEWLFGSGKNKNTAVSTTIPTSPYICNCAKTCTQISTCKEAYYQLDNCGCSVRDGDNDGIPCESLCQ